MTVKEKEDRMLFPVIFGKSVTFQQSGKHCLLFQDQRKFLVQIIELLGHRLQKLGQLRELMKRL